MKVGTTATAFDPRPTFFFHFSNEPLAIFSRRQKAAPVIPLAEVAS
jgi:hypothetical protein